MPATLSFPQNAISVLTGKVDTISNVLYHSQITICKIRTHIPRYWYHMYSQYQAPWSCYTSPKKAWLREAKPNHSKLLLPCLILLKNSVCLEVVASVAYCYNYTVFGTIIATLSLFLQQQRLFKGTSRLNATWCTS